MQLTRALAALALASVTLGACSAAGGRGGPAPETTAPGTTFSIGAHVAAGTDELLCQFVSLSDAPAFVESFAHTASFAFHHVYVYATDLAAMPPGVNPGPVDCRTDPSNPMVHARASLYASERSTDELALPSGVGLPVAAGAPLLVQVHYLNAGAGDVDVTGSLDVGFVAADPGTHAGAFFFNDPFIDVAPGAVAQASMRCAVPADVTVLTTVGAGRSHSIGFEAFFDPPASVAENPYYHAPGWADPLPLAATLPMAAGSHLRFGCTFDNSGGTSELLQGASPDTSEQCALSGLYYPDRGVEFSSCEVAPDMFGTGTATCAATRRCVDACGLSSAPPPDLGLAGEPATIEACWQRCVVASCPGASAPLLALTACLETHSDAECQAEASACEASACTP